MNGINIVSLPVGAGSLAICPMPGANGAYSADLATLVAWQPDVVLSMTKPEEFAGPLPVDLAKAAIAWEHFPVCDMNAPPPEVQELWPDVSARLRAVLKGGGRVLVHCFGGCGRSGMAVLRLMIETGASPQTALSRLRSVRPCAVETEAQLAWALAAIPTPFR